MWNNPYIPFDFFLRGTGTKKDQHLSWTNGGKITMVAFMVWASSGIESVLSSTLPFFLGVYNSYCCQMGRSGWHGIAEEKWTGKVLRNSPTTPLPLQKTSLNLYILCELRIRNYEFAFTHPVSDFKTRMILKQVYPLLICFWCLLRMYRSCLIIKWGSVQWILEK